MDGATPDCAPPMGERIAGLTLSSTTPDERVGTGTAGDLESPRWEGAGMDATGAATPLAEGVQAS
tara:strand:- start:280 stop:474 length:195 start_codon:yes stop_codon:yes gene_type:complete